MCSCTLCKHESTESGTGIPAQSLLTLLRSTALQRRCKQKGNITRILHPSVSNLHFCPLRIQLAAPNLRNSFWDSVLSSPAVFAAGTLQYHTMSISILHTCVPHPSVCLPPVSLRLIQTEASQACCQRRAYCLKTEFILSSGVPTLALDGTSWLTMLPKQTLAFDYPLFLESNWARWEKGHCSLLTYLDSDSVSPTGCGSNKGHV